MRRWLAVLLIAMGAVAVLSQAVRSVAQAPAAPLPRLPDGKPNFTGLWQALGTAHWDIRDHIAQPGPILQLGAAGAVPGGQGIVEGNEIPYQPWAAAKQKENFANRLALDPEIKCYMPGVPRGMYMPFPLQIVQSPQNMVIAHEYATANRVIQLAKPREAAIDTWMGTSNGKWEKDTLVVEVTGLNGLSWFDRAGNFASENVRIVERFTFAGADHINYQATIEDKTVFTRPWTISFPLYRRKEKNAQLTEFKCVPFVEELLYGQLRKQTK